MNGTVTGQRVRVHVNLHEQRFAIVDPTTGRVIRYANDVTLSGVQFRHQKACVEKIRETGQRKVCAYAIGTFECLDSDAEPGGRYVRYNPHVRPDFHDPVSGATVEHAERVVFVGLRAYDVTPAAA